MTIPILALMLAGQPGDPVAAAMSMTTSLIILAAALLLVASMWKVFERAGEPGWAVIIPIYNLYVLTKVAQVSAAWMIAMLLPFLNIIAVFVVANGVAKRFGKSTGFGIGLVLLPFLFYPMLAWGDDQPSPRLA
jgi:TRAP-type C4-dicarboxylate transport system permease small subunit